MALVAGCSPPSEMAGEEATETPQAPPDAGFSDGRNPPRRPSVQGSDQIKGPEAPPVSTVPPQPPQAPDTDTSSFVPAGSRTGIGTCPLYPRNNVFRADASKLKVLPESDAIINALGPDEVLRPPKSKIHQGSRGGLPINVVDSRTTTPNEVISLRYGYERLGSYPIPSDPMFEGHPGIAWDQHLILVDEATCVSHELFLVDPPNRTLHGKWEADSAVSLDLTTNTIPPKGATASGFSLLAGMVRYEELASGSIDHVISVGLPKIRNVPALWPAHRTDGRSSDPNAPRMGQWLRLKNVDLSGFGPSSRTIIKALQKHGAVVKDTNLNGISINYENDSRWDDDDLQDLKQLKASDFEVVDASPMMVSSDSYEIR